MTKTRLQMDSNGKDDLKQTQNSLITSKSDNKESEMAKSKSIIASSAERKPSNIKIDLLTYRQESHQTFPLSFTEFDWSLLVCPDSVLVWVTSPVTSLVSCPGAAWCSLGCLLPVSLKGFDWMKLWCNPVVAVGWVLSAADRDLYIVVPFVEPFKL